MTKEQEHTLTVIGGVIFAGFGAVVAGMGDSVGWGALIMGGLIALSGLMGDADAADNLVYSIFIVGLYLAASIFIIAISLGVIGWALFGLKLLF